MRRSLAALALAVVLPAGVVFPSASRADVVVKPGETLSEIAERNGVSLTRLMQANGISDPAFVEAGRRLVIPGSRSTAAASRPAPASGGSYTVKSGETLSEIADRNGTTVERLMQLNGISNANLVAAGTRLILPGQPRRSVAQPGNARQHVVQSGETLSHIADAYNVPVERLIALNKISDPNLVVAGTRLQLKAPPAVPQPRPVAQKPKPAAKPTPKAVTVAAKPTAAKPVAAKPVAAKPVAAKPIASQSADTKPSETKPADTNPSAASAVAAKPAAKPVVTNPVATKPAETKPTETKPAETKTVASKPVESKPVESKSVEAKPLASTTTAAKPVSRKPVVQTSPVASKPTTNKTGPDWRTYGPMQIDWANWRSMGGSLVAPSLGSDGKPHYLAVNCGARKINATSQSGQWKTWDNPQSDEEQRLVTDLCSSKGG